MFIIPHQANLINIILEYQLLPDVQILSVNMANNGFEGESSYMWLNLANNHLRGGDIIIKVETNIDGLVITPSKIEMFKLVDNLSLKLQNITLVKYQINQIQTFAITITTSKNNKIVYFSGCLFW